MRDSLPLSLSLSLYMCVYLVDDEEEYLDELITTGKFYVSGIYKQERERERGFVYDSFLLLVTTSRQKNVIY